MLERIDDLPDGVLGFVAKGELTAADYDDILIPAVHQALGAHEKLRMLYVLGEGFEGITAGGMWDDTKAGFAHITRWERIAVVTDKDWIRHGVDIFGYLLPGDVRTFASNELEAARTWITA